MKSLDRYDAINPLSLTESVNLIAPFTEGEFLRPEHIVIRNVPKLLSLIQNGNLRYQCLRYRESVVFDELS